jgi:glycosyltransferase involved in cell wall biosynthesis
MVALQSGTKAMTSIVVDCRMIFSSGIGTYISNLVPRVVAKLPDVRFVILGDPIALAELPWTRAANVMVVAFTARPFSLAERLSFPRRLLRRADAVWWPHYNVPIGVALGSLGPLVCTVHDAAQLALPDLLLRGWHKRLYVRFMFELVRRCTSTILFVSDFSRMEFLRLVGSPRGRHKVIHNGLADIWFNTGTDAQPRPRPYLVYVGNVKPHKNLGAAIAAFGLIADRIPHDFVIVGRKDGFMTGDAAIPHLAARFGDRIALTGQVTDAELRCLVANADALVFPSLYEGFGFPPLEAMACGCPVVVADAASLPEICGEAAVYFNPTDPRDMADRILAGTFRSGRQENLLIADNRTDIYLQAPPAERSHLARLAWGPEGGMAASDTVGPSP